MTDADRIAALEAEIAFLRDTFGLDKEAQGYRLLRNAFRLSRLEAVFVLTLHRAEGRAVQAWSVMSAMYPNPADEPDIKVLHVRCHHIRSKMGPGCVETVYGMGYCLTRDGMDKVSKALGQDS